MPGRVIICGARVVAAGMTAVGFIGSGMIGGTVDRLDGAAASGDLVVVSVPLHAFPHLPAGPLAGRTVLDTGNYYPQRDNQIPELDSGKLASSEWLQNLLPGAAVV